VAPTVFRGKLLEFPGRSTHIGNSFWLRSLLPTAEAKNSLNASSRPTPGAGLPQMQLTHDAANRTTWTKCWWRILGLHELSEVSGNASNSSQHAAPVSCRPGHLDATPNAGAPKAGQSLLVAKNHFTSGDDRRDM
jgi:hypothetical protein